MISAQGNDVGLVVWVSRYNVVLIALGIVTVVCLMVLPIPLFLLDALIGLNIAISIGLLLLTVYIDTPLTLSTFPTLLLFTTLLRLSLNIASSRSILLIADAGHIIETFGRLVVGGNVVVGLVVFVIITVVQFIVIAKGAERVAEVSARFSLDAMPGKQMSIDADLRAGLIDKEGAMRRRTMLEKESQLHGAMDGAMKFVKGDAIAGLLIALVNIIAGLAVGTAMHGMSFSDAVDRYTILTAGDGLVTQIPSLFVSIAAGVLTTRVSGNEKGNLGGEIVGQIFGQPTALLVTGIILLGFLVVPGFPPGQFLLLGAVVGGIGYVLLRQGRRRASGARAPMPQMRGDDNLIDARVPPLVDERMPAITVPLLVRVSDDFGARLSASRFSKLLEELRGRLLEDVGLPFPGVRLVRDARLASGAYRVLVYDVPVSDRLAPPGKRLFVAAPGTALPKGAQVDVSLEWLGFAAWLDFAGKAAVAPAGWKEIDADSLLAVEIQRIIGSRPHEFLGLQDTQRLLQRAESDIGDLVKEIAKAVPLHRMTDVLRRLLAEGVPIRNLRAIGECLVMWGTREKDVVMLTELVRVELGRWIAQRYTRGARQLAAVLIHPDTEMLFKRSIQQNASGSFLAVDPDERNRFCAELSRLIGETAADAQRPVVLTTMDLRRYVYKLIETALPGTVVLSYEEIAAHVDLAVRGTVGGAGKAAAVPA